MGDRGTFIAEHPGPNPLADGVVIASRDGSALQPLETPGRYALPHDERDHRLAAFRALVREIVDGEWPAVAIVTDQALASLEVGDATVLLQDRLALRPIAVVAYRATSSTRP